VSDNALTNFFRLTSLFGFASLLGFAVLPAASLQAQPAPWQYPYYDGYPPPLPPGPIAARETSQRDYYGAEEGANAIVPLAEIRRHVAVLGFHLIAKPRHKDRIYLAEAEDAHGLRHRIVFDAYDGKVIENTNLGLKIKRASAKVSGETASAANSEKAAAGYEKKVAASPKRLTSKPAPIPDPANGDPD
jgi:hypothetical protein